MNLQAWLDGRGFGKGGTALSLELREVLREQLRAFARDLLLEAAKRTCRGCEQERKVREDYLPNRYHMYSGEIEDCQAEDIHLLLAELEAEEGK